MKMKHYFEFFNVYHPGKYTLVITVPIQIYQQTIVNILR